MRIERNRRSGLTLVELMVAISIIGILLSFSVPVFQKSIRRAKETVLRINLRLIREEIGAYAFDQRKAPESLRDLIEQDYLNEMPLDPIAGSRTSWRTEPEDPRFAVDQGEPGIANVRSSSDESSLEGTRYSEW